MTEKRILELLTRKLAGEITPDEYTELRELMSGYSDARHLKEVSDEIWNHEIEQVDVADLYRKHRDKYDHNFQEGAEDSLASFSEVPALGIFTKYRSLFVTALALGSLLTLSLLFFANKEFRDPEFTEIIAGKGVRKEVRLPDGTRVWLNGDSKLSYDPLLANSGNRQVALSGEAFFDVAHDASRPFLIKTDKYSIKVLGTSFNVSAYPNDKKSETTLIRGSVELTMNDGSRQTIVLQPQEKVALINDEKKTIAPSGRESSKESETLLIQPIKTVKLANREYVPEISWKENKLIFDNETMEEIGRKLERWFNVKITVTGEISRFHFTGVFEKETIEQALQAMQLIKPFNYKSSENEINIY